MAFKILVNSDLKKRIFLLTIPEKTKLRNTLDLMESIGQIGEPLYLDLNVWKVRIDNLRLIYHKTSTEIRILSILKGLDPTIV